MEQIAQKARDLKEFLSRPELVNEYYEAALEYYGPDKFPRNAFDAVLNQLRELDARVPALAQRLWETTNLGQGFEIQAAAKTSGLELKVSNWERHLEKWSGGLEKEAKAVLAISDPKRRAEYVKGVLEEASSSLSTFEAEVSSLPRVERIQRSKEFFLAFASGHPQFRAAGAYLVLEKIRSTEIDDLLRSKDADLVLDTIEKLRSSALEVPGGELCPKNLRSLILREHLPELSVPRLELINGQPAETELFRTLTRTGNRGTKVVLGRGGKAVYRFKPLPRRFHGIWKGIPLGECVGGSCNSLDALTPERWATIALKDSQIHNIERGDSYLGFVQYVPVRKGKKIYASVDLGAPILKNKVFVEEAASHRIEGKPMFDLWFKESLARKPGDWKGFVIGKSGAINNAGVLETARTSLPHDFGQIVGDSKEFTHLDPLAKQIVAASPTSHSFQRTYGGRMVTDGTVPDAAALTKLQRLSDDALNDPETVAKIIAGPNAKIRDKVLVFLKEHPPTDPRMQIMLARALANSHAEIADTCALILLKDRTGSEELIRHLDSLLTQQDKVIQLR
ncbi:MAG: hypothetical protein ACXVBW_12255, partial [Bdellovibrionota bacterium]